MASPACRRLAIALAIGFLAAATAARADNVLRRANHDEPETLDPAKADGAEESWVQNDMFEGLTRVDPHGRIIPGLAESWDISADGLTWTFHLRHGLEWSDGSPLTSADFVWSLQRAVDPRTAAPYASILYPIVGAEAINSGAEKNLAKLGVTAPDPDTVVIRLLTPTAYLPGVLTINIAFPVPRKAIAAYGEKWTRPGKIISDGAFEMADWVPLQEVSMVRNPHYYDAAKVKLDGVRWIVVEDDLTGMRSFRDGELDIARLPIVEYPAAMKNTPQEVHAGVNLWTVYLMANTTRPPFSDVRLRQALSMSIDRHIIVTRVTPHGAQPAFALVPPGMEGYTPQPPDWAALSYRDRIARAKALVREAGYGPDHPLKVELIYPSSESARAELGAMVAMWQPIGIDVTLQAEENQVIEATTRHLDYTLSYYGWIADYPDPWTFLSVHRSNAGGLNTSGYRNPEYDALLEQASRTLDPPARMQLLEAAERLFARDQPVIPIEYGDTPRLVSPRVQNYFDNALDHHDSRDIWLTPPAVAD